MNRINERVCILIDGANFYLSALKPLGIQDANFDYEAFTQFLADGRKLDSHGKRYYIGTVREVFGDPSSVKAMSRQNALFSRLISTHWEIKTSIHKKKTETIVVDNKVQDYVRLKGLGINQFTFEKNREKGIDVKLAVDLIVGAVDNKYDTIIIISSDTDIIPAIDWVQNRFSNKRIEYIGFSIPNKTEPWKAIQPTLALVKKSDVQRILIESDLRKFVI